jgi:hypothetical protein
VKQPKRVAAAPVQEQAAVDVVVDVDHNEDDRRAHYSPPAVVGKVGSNQNAGSEALGKLDRFAFLPPFMISMSHIVVCCFSVWQCKLAKPVIWKLLRKYWKGGPKELESALKEAGVIGEAICWREPQHVIYDNLVSLYFLSFFFFFFFFPLPCFFVLFVFSSLSTSSTSSSSFFGFIYFFFI